MKTSNSIKRTTSFIIIFSIIYTIFEVNIGFLLPIITVILPFKFMKEKEDSQNAYNKDKKTLTRLLLFNFISIEVASLLTKNYNSFTFNLSASMLIYLIYLMVLANGEKKLLKIKDNPEALYSELQRRIDNLEDMYNKTVIEMENASNERDKRKIQVRINKLSNKINASKKQLDMIESLLNNKK